MLRWLVLDLNSFFASCEQQDNVELRGKLVIVVPTMAETTCAIAASYQAKAFGIKTGTIVRDARKLCPDVQLTLARHRRYVEYHHQILTAIDKKIPIDDVMSIDEVACRLDKKQQDPATAYILGQAIKECIRREVGDCMTSSVGIAPNKLLAKLASNMQKPDGLRLLPLGSLPDAIIPLKLSDIPGIGHGMEERLRHAGISSIAELWAAPASHLRLIWGGVAGLKMHGLLHGKDIVSPRQGRTSIGHQHVLAPDERSKVKSEPIMRALVIRAASRLRTDGYYCRGLAISIKWIGEQGGWENGCRFKEVQDTQFLLHAMESLWVRVPLLAKPFRVGIVLVGLTPESAHQPDLFDVPSRRLRRTSELARAVDAVNAKYGLGVLNFGFPVVDHGRKIAFQSVPKLEEL